MEKYYHNTRFILICNYVTKIIPPLASRCSKFRFLPIDYESSKSMINNMLKLEGYNVNISEEIFEYVYKYTIGDLRKTITLFQRLSYIVKFENLTIDIIRESIGEISDDLLTEIITLIENKISIENQKNIFNIVKRLISLSYNCLFLINNLYNYYLENTKIDDKIKGKIINKLSDIDNKLNNGSIEIIQMCNLLIFINSVYNNINFNIINNPFTILIS